MHFACVESLENLLHTKSEDISDALVDKQVLRSFLLVEQQQSQLFEAGLL